MGRRIQRGVRKVGTIDPKYKIPTPEQGGRKGEREMLDVRPSRSQVEDTREMKCQKIAKEIFEIMRANNLTLLEKNMVLESLNRIILNQVRM